MRDIACPVCTQEEPGLFRCTIVGLATIAMLAGMLTAGCANRSASVLQRDWLLDAGQERPELTGELPTHPAQERLAKSALRGRLLVKIEKAETLKRYRPEAFDENALREAPPQFRELASRLNIHHASELGLAKTGKPLVQLHLAMPRRAAEVEAALSQLHLRLRRDYGWPQQSDSLVDLFVVEGDLGLSGATELPGGRRRFPQLKPESNLNAAFTKLGVGSIRRIFRMTEQPDGKGMLQVVPLLRLLDETRERYPVRASRGYPDLNPSRDLEDWFLLRLDRDVDLAGVAAALEKARGINTVFFDYALEYHQAPQDEPEYPNQWALQPAGQWGIDALPAWNVVTPAPSNVRVAVIDSGFKEDLNEFAGRIWSKACRSGQVPTSDHCEIPANGIDDDLNGYIDDVKGVTTNDRYTGVPGPIGTGGAVVEGDHGTKVAGIIAANATNGVLIAGVAGAAPVVLMNVSIGSGAGCAELAEAITYATLEGADIANISLGVRPHYLVWEAIQAALSRDGGGVTVIASAGNRNRRATENYLTENATYPAWYPGVISVGGTDRSGRRWVEPGAGAGSNYGVGLDLVAPAKEVATVTYAAGSIAAIHTTMTGTSGSAAIVSGVAAIVLSH